MRTRSGTGRLGLVATMIVTLLLACSAPSSPSSGATESSGKPYGSLVVVSSASMEQIEPGFMLTSFYPAYLVCVYDSLTSLDTNGNVTPGLAERWELSADGLTHTYYIRKGVKFHDGSDLTAADVKFTMERLLAPDAPGAAAVNTSVTLWRGLAPQVELKDNYTVVVKFKTPQFGLPKPMNDFMGVLAVAPKKYIEEKGVEYFHKNPVGSGPWKVVSYEFGQRLQLEANEDYWDSARIPKFKNLTLITVPEESTRVAMLKTGEADMGEISPESAVTLKSAGLRVKSWDGGQQAYYSLYYDTKNPAPYPLSDLRVRKATSLSLNRQEMADKLFSGYAEPGILHRVQRTFDFFDASQLKADPYDPEGAKKLLAEAGYPNGFATKVWDTGGGHILSTFNQALAGYWRKVGINATTEPVDSAGVAAILRTYSDPRMWNTIYPVGIGTAGGVSPVGFDITVIWHSTKGAYRNHTNKRLDELIDLYPATRDPSERLKIAREATILAKNEYSAVSALIVQAVWALGPKIGELTPTQGQPFVGVAYATVTHSK